MAHFKLPQANPRAIEPAPNVNARAEPIHFALATTALQKPPSHETNRHARQTIKMKIPLIFKVIALWLLGSRGFLLASSEGPIHSTVTSAEVLAGNSGYKFEFRSDSAGLLKQVVSSWKEQRQEFNDKAFGAIRGVYLRGVQINSLDDIAAGEQEYVIVILPYNVKAIGSGKDTWRVSDVIRLHFHNGNLVRWQKAEADPKIPQRWISSSWDEGNGIKIQGAEMKRINPFAAFDFDDGSP